MGDVDGKGVLDLACGTGHYARLLKARGAENVHGVDNSEELLKEARRHESADGVTYYRHDLIEGPPPKPLFTPEHDAAEEGAKTAGEMIAAMNLGE